ncbi:Trichome birefringence-like family [Quillaja saponaria]|uniref:Trichome birefringence-like family n=1 Tax=Quillaja saponaria TaxID=32244 RepID=A0AAD7Q4K7_QUISA|nr:Trichome birefringence-like family [Quillaja saponaria]
MKFSNTTTLFQDKLHSHFKRERGLNMSSLVPFVLTSLFLASVFTFFLLYSPNSLTFIPKQTSDFVQQNQQELPHQTNITSIPQMEKEAEKCDLFMGHWVPAVNRSSFYTNSSCPTIPESKNCFKNGRKDNDFLNWKWKPEKCELPRFDSKTFLDFVRGKKMAFVGDSVARNHMESLLCLLSQEETPKDVYKDSEDHLRRWYFPRYDFTLIIIWSKFLIAGEERIINGTGSNIFDLQLDKVDDIWAKDLPDFDYTVISDGHWFNRVMYLHEGDKLVGCVYCREPNVTDFNIDFPFRIAFRTAFKYINSCKNCKKMVTLFRTFAPAHFESGAWNSGGYCNSTSPLSEGEVDFGKFEWQLRNAQIEEFEGAKEEGNRTGHKFELVDVTRAMLMRPDGHPGAHWGNKWMKGYNDCTHWCMPGPVDIWNELMMEVMIRESGLRSGL